MNSTYSPKSCNSEKSTGKRTRKSISSGARPAERVIAVIALGPPRPVLSDPPQADNTPGTEGNACYQTPPSPEADNTKLPQEKRVIAPHTRLITREGAITPRGCDNISRALWLREKPMPATQHTCVSTVCTFLPNPSRQANVLQVSAILRSRPRQPLAKCASRHWRQK